MLPAFFVSHGAPSLAFDDVPARGFLRDLGQQIGKPRAILMVSAHWDTPAPQVNSMAVNDTIHDFRGFSPALHAVRYPAPGDAPLARQVAVLTGGTLDTTRGLDHGAWVPLMLMYPGADVPVVQLSVQSHLGAAHHIALGRKLAALRGDNVLVIGTGGFVHNLGQLASPGAPEPDWSREFSDWMHERLMAGDEAALADYRSSAPHAVLAQPTEDHFMPLFVAFGAGGQRPKAARLHTSATFGSLRMDAYSFT
ncbi:dioxygenase [Rhizomicrobium sp. SCGC AG-212-E05]|nr:dioxygenase [Rhizomicrobium sp. SCGC AG-212-E05]